jgi:tetratricopeptide (TPR) repeat protein
MRKDWHISVAASLLAVAVTGAPAWGNPAGMAVSSRSAKAAPAPSASPQTVAAGDVQHPLPSSQISPKRHPFKYFAAAISEMPVGPNGHRVASANAVMPPVQPQSDPIALGAPTPPPTPQLFIAAAQICESKGEIDKARGNYQKALATWPGQVDVLRAAARMEDRLGQMPVAENLYRQAVALNPQHAGAHNDLGLCLARQGKLEASVQEIERAIQLQPAKALYRNNAATVLVEMREDQRAIAHLATVHGAAEANYNFGQLLVQRGRAADATPYFEAAVQQNPLMQHAHVALAKLQGATAATTASVATESPVTAPQDASNLGPVMTYPSTAQSPDVNTSGYVPPRALPPVASQPGQVRR